MISGSIGQTHKIAKDLVEQIVRHRKSNIANIIGLSGELGSGKTTFAQGFARALGVKERVISPTFVILKRFKIRGSRFKNLIHIDAYRINKPKEIIDLGWKEIINDPQNIILIEWAEKIKKILPQKHFFINFKHINKNKRWIKIKKF
jgi:tRNA threonylcarbamoyladenosine biosynthesis protein TsaE